MTVVTLDPDGTVSNTGALTGGATAHAVLADSSDASFVVYEVGEKSIVNFGDLTLPSGAVVKSVRANVRCKSVAGYPYSEGQVVLSISGGIGNPLVTWSNFTDIVVATTSGVVSDAQVDAATLEVGLSSAFDLTVAKASLSATYVTKPTTTVTAPSGTLTESNRPAITWSNAFDADGGAQTAYLVRVYDASTHGAFGSVDPDVTAPYVEFSGTGSALSWTPTEPLPDDDYRVYVAVAQTVNGVAHWSDWDSQDFEIDVALPGTPTLTATADSANGRITLALTEESGDADTDFWEIESSSTGVDGSWSPLRTLLEDGQVTNPTPGSSGTATVYDYEAANGVQTFYRARAVVSHSDVLTVASDWATDDATWSSSAVWIKHPTNPSLNVAPGSIFSQPGYDRPSRRGVFQGLGSPTAIVVSDLPSPPVGQIVIEQTGKAGRTALDALTALPVPLLIQAPPSHHWEDRWVSLADLERRPMVDKLENLDTHNAFNWNEVTRPSGVISAWPS